MSYLEDLGDRLLQTYDSDSYPPHPSEMSLSVNIGYFVIFSVIISSTFALVLLPFVLFSLPNIVIFTIPILVVLFHDKLYYGIKQIVQRVGILLKYGKS